MTKTVKNHTYVAHIREYLLPGYHPSFENQQILNFEVVAVRDVSWFLAM